MAKIDHANALTLVTEFRKESAAYLRQWVLWLGLGSGGGAVAMLSLAANLPDPGYAFELLLPSFWSFTVGMSTAGLGLYLASLRDQQSAEHFASAHNRDALCQLAGTMSEIISSPRSIADKANRERNSVLERVEKADLLAETAWVKRSRYSLYANLLFAVSNLAFLVGIVWPLSFVSFGGSLVP